MIEQQEQMQVQPSQTVLSVVDLSFRLVIPKRGSIGRGICCVQARPGLAKA
jgi:hypothetical protein